MANSINYDFAAQVLAEASFAMTDKEVYDRYGVSKQTFAGWKRALKSDITLIHYFTHKKAALENEWGADASRTIRAALDFLARAAAQADPKNPDAIHAVAGSLKIVNEAQATLRYLNMRLGHADSSTVGKPVQQTGQVHRELPAPTKSN